MYQLLTDSACDLPRQTLADANVNFVSFHFNVEGQDLTDDMGGSYELKDFFAKIKNGVMPSTSAINVGEYVDFFTPYAKAGTPVAYIAFSSGLSSSFEAATEAKAMVLEKYPEAQIALVDTLAASEGEGRMVLEAIRLQKEGKTLAELVAWFEENRCAFRNGLLSIRWIICITAAVCHAHRQRWGRCSTSSRSWTWILWAGCV